MAGKHFKILVCRGPECGERRHSADVHAALKRELSSADLGGNQVTLDSHSCFGQCQRGVNVLVREIRAGENAFMLSMMPTSAPGACLYHGVRPKDAKQVLEEHVGKGQEIGELKRRVG